MDRDDLAALEQRVARTAALALHAQALLERTRSAPPSRSRADNLLRLELAVRRARTVLHELAADREPATAH